MVSYPPDLLSHIKAAWLKTPAREGLDDSSQIPPDDHILTMLEVAFHAGLQTEEGRPLQFRLAYLDPHAARSLEAPRRVLRFETPLPLETTEIVKLAPVADPRRCAIGVYPVASDTPRIWGLVDSGISPWELRHNFGMADQDGGEPAPPSHLEIAVDRPGAMTVSSGRNHLCTLAAGVIRSAPVRLWDAGPLSLFFRAICDAFRDSLRARDAYRPSYLTNLPLFFVESLIGRVTRVSHGATLIFVPEGFADAGSARAHELKFKYELRDPCVWALMMDRFVAEHRYFDKLEAVRVGGDTTGADDAFALYLEGEEWRTLGVSLQDRAELFASLAAVDGGVVLDTRLRLLGFGAEILADDVDRDGKKLTDVVLDGSHARCPITGYGTRHRSAFRLCFKDDSVACIVVSSDGPARGVRRVGSDVRLWPALSV